MNKKELLRGIENLVNQQLELLKKPNETIEDIRIIRAKIKAYNDCINLIGKIDANNRLLNINN